MSFHDVTNTILSHDGNYTVGVVMLPESNNSSTPRKKFIIKHNLLRISLEKTFFLRVLLV